MMMSSRDSSMCCEIPLARPRQTAASGPVVLADGVGWAHAPLGGGDRHFHLRRDAVANGGRVRPGARRLPGGWAADVCGALPEGTAEAAQRGPRDRLWRNDSGTGGDRRLRQANRAVRV